ncbi:sensor histidine kinase [Streptomyces sp. NPDC060194]|uniref:sensor histidine kinase n=1 Tax=Streptomyces sp. NPDC060194 TaxID=3347069 RepID=UPI00364A0DEE
MIDAPSSLPRPLPAVAYVAGGVVSGVATAVVMVLLAGFSVVLVGLPLLLLAGVPVAAVERWRAGLVPSPHRVPGEPGLGAWARLRLGEPATWRELAYAVLHAGVLWVLDACVLGAAVVAPVATAVTPLLLAMDGEEVRVVKMWLVTGYPAAFATAALGLALTVALSYPLRAYAGARAALTRLLLAPDGRAELTEVTASRARLVAAFEAERRRIERDLHDGAQQRLVALTMRLGLARLDAPAGGPLAEELARAHEEAGLVLTELRELIRGIHPQVLTDYGLAAALTDAADRSPVPVDTVADGLPRLPGAVETAAYFAVSEGLANVAKHSGASRARLTARHERGRLWVELGDDGRGGADGAHGSGLTGLADRLAVLDGTLTITSPPGGPTVVRLEIPCPAL